MIIDLPKRVTFALLFPTDPDDSIMEGVDRQAFGVSEGGVRLNLRRAVSCFESEQFRPGERATILGEF